MKISLKFSINHMAELNPPKLLPVTPDQSSEGGLLVTLLSNHENLFMSRNIFYKNTLTKDFFHDIITTNLIELVEYL